MNKPEVRGNVNPAQIMNTEKDAIAGICQGRRWETHRTSEIKRLTERVIKGRESVTKNKDDEGFFLGIHVPVTKSKAS